jgi:hypothetical protein
METIGTEKLWSFSKTGLRPRTCFNIRKLDACTVENFLDLATKVAYLQYKNPNFVMLFRGQDKDHKRINKKHDSFTSLSPKIFRPSENRRLESEELQQRFDQL